MAAGYEHLPHAMGEMTIMLHDVQRILGIGIEGSLPAEPAEGEWKGAITGLFGEPMSELRWQPMGALKYTTTFVRYIITKI